MKFTDENRRLALTSDYSQLYLRSFSSLYQAPEMLEDLLNLWTPAAYYVVAMSVGK